MNRDQMRMWLERRYVEICKQFPMFNQDVSLSCYVSANLPYMERSTYWRAQTWK